MKLITAILILTVLPLAPINGQTRLYRIGGIRRIAKFEGLDNKPAIEIKVSGPHNVGGLYYCLRIGTLPGIPERGFLPNESAMLFYLAEKDWKKLKNKSPLWVTWGCLSPSMYDSLEPMAYLDKKMLTKDQTKVRQGQ